MHTWLSDGTGSTGRTIVDVHAVAVMTQRTTEIMACLPIFNGRAIRSWPPNYGLSCTVVASVAIFSAMRRESVPKAALSAATSSS